MLTGQNNVLVCGTGEGGQSAQGGDDLLDAVVQAHPCATHSPSAWHPLSAPGSFKADSLYSRTQPLPSCSHSLATTHPPSQMLSSPLVSMQTPPLHTLSGTTSPLARHRHPPSPGHMQSRGISFYCLCSPCNPTQLPFIHCNNTFGVEVVLLRAATQTTLESQVLAQNCSYL